MAYGDMLGFIDSYEFDTGLGDIPHILHVSGDIYAICYRSETALDLITVKISSLGVITKPYEDKLPVHATRPYNCRILHVSGQIYAIVGRDSQMRCAMNTVSIQPNGQIADTLLDSQTWDVVDMSTHSMYSISSDVILLAYEGDGHPATLRTFIISDSGLITIPHKDELVFHTIGSPGHDIIQVNSGVFAVIYEGPDGDGWLKTFTVDGDGWISDSTIDFLEFSTDIRLMATICHVTGNIYAIAYSSDGWTPYLETVSIDPEGQIGSSAICTKPYHPAAAGDPMVIHIGLGIVVVAYQGTPGTGWVSSFQISKTGSITATPIGTYNYDPVYARDPSIILISGDIYAIAYEGPDSDGFLQTCKILTPPVSGPHHEFTLGLGP